MTAMTTQPHTTAPIPPQNLDAEESILGAILISHTATQACRTILNDGHDFYRATHGTIYRACIALHDRDEPVDAITVADELDRRGQLDQIGGPERIHELATIVPSTANAAHYAGIVHELARRRDIIRLGEQAMRLGWDGQGDVAHLHAELDQLYTNTITGRAAAGQATVETWHEFESKAHDRIPTVVDGLWPEAAFGFLAAPPKKGKTWVAIALAVSVATGTRFLDHFTIPQPRTVLYVALEGHRAGIRARVGAIARGMGINPDTDQLGRLHWLYKPAGINLADPAWTRTIRQSAEQIGATLIIVDVLRAAARIKENDSAEFATLRHNLQPITDAGISIAMLHHFGKLTELQRDRTPGERMSGSGAMFGALDAAIYITGSEEGARRLRLEFDTRDLATPDHLNVHLDGQGTGDNGGYTYRDTATFTATEDEVPADDFKKAPPDEIKTYVENHGGDVEAIEIRAFFGISSETLTRRAGRLSDIGVDYIGGRGKATRLVLRPEPAPAPDQTEMALQSQNKDAAQPYAATSPETALLSQTVAARHELPHAATSPDAATKPHNHAGLPEVAARYRTNPVRQPESGDLQGNQDAADAASLRDVRVRARARDAQPDHPAFDRHEAERQVRQELWQHDDPATAIAQRWPDAPILEIKRLTRLAHAIAAEEAGR
jgi:hypothetical protein